jgi:4-diphosphocytidyl-2-C-methyl-D-erythritol kinase
MVYPEAPSSTADVFRTGKILFSKPTAPPKRFENINALIAFLDGTRNDLEKAAKTLTPAIAEAHAAVSAQAGCRLARMSGSGSTVFGIFDDPAACLAAERNIQAARPGWWVKATKTV